MAHDETLAARVRAILAGSCGWSERRMFGGLCFLYCGHMSCGLVGDALMVRVGPDAYAAALRRPHVREMDFTGRPLRGLIYVDPPGLRTAAALRGWIELGRAYTATLPAKP